MPKKLPSHIKPPVGYPAHRERQRRRILDAARTLFDQSGIDRVTMAEITSASGVQASTVYQYFSSKAEIVWAITGELFAASAVAAKTVMEAAPSALAKIAALLESMADALTSQRREVRFMAQFDALYAQDLPVERLIALESQIIPEGFDYFTRLIHQGMADGSLRSDLDPELTMHAVINAVVGAQRRLASLGEKVEQEYGHPVDRLFRETVRVLLLGLRAPDPPPKLRQIKPKRSPSSQAARRLP